MDVSAFHVRIFECSAETNGGRVCQFSTSTEYTFWCSSGSSAQTLGLAVCECSWVDGLQLALMPLDLRLFDMSVYWMAVRAMRETYCVGNQKLTRFSYPTLSGLTKVNMTKFVSTL